MQVSRVDVAAVPRKSPYVPESFAVSTQRFAELTAAKIKAHIAKGDQAAAKSEQHYIAAGQYLKELKEHHKGDWAGWELTLKEKIGIGKSRASELMQIADGRKTLTGLRIAKAESVRKVRENASPLRSGENVEGDDELETAETDLVEDPQNYKTAFLLRADTAIHLAVYSGPILTMDMVEIARTAAAKWDSLARSMAEAFAHEHPRRVIPAPEQQPPDDGIPDSLRRVAR